jgi:hypothetical protein
MKRIVIFFMVILIFSGMSCKNKADYSEAIVASDMAPAAEMDERNMTKDQTTVIDRRIIKEGEISFETADNNETRKLINKWVKEFNAYISLDNVNDQRYRIENRITIRVPSEKFEALLSKISESAKKLDIKNISATDVTEEYVDIEARLQTKKELENRYKVLLERARTIDEILKIEKQIGDLRTEIESIEGRYKYLNDRISFSTLTVVFYERTNSAFGFSSKFGQAVKSGWENVLWVLIGLTNLWPFLIILAIVLFVLLRKRKKVN